MIFIVIIITHTIPAYVFVRLLGSLTDKLSSLMGLPIPGCWWAFLTAAKSPLAVFRTACRIVSIVSSPC